MKDLKFNILLNDQYSAKLKSIASGSKRSFSDIETSLRKTGKLGTNLESLNNKLDFLEKKRRISLDISEMKNITKEIRQVNREIDLIERKSGMRKGGGASNFIGKAGLMLGGVAAVGGGLMLGKDIVETSAKYEGFETVLKNTYQNGMKASQAMSEISKFAAATPYQIDELTGSFIKLENAGFKPTMKSMTLMGDLAASRGKSFGQLSEALMDATMGEFERLKEFGIKASTGKNTYKFTFKGETTEIKKSAEAVNEYILSLGKLKGIQGGMAAVSKTTGGAISNLADSWDQLKSVIGSANSGPVKDAILGMTSLVTKAKQWFSVPLSQKMQEEKGNINGLVSAITSYNITSDERMSLLNQLKEQYPEFLSKLDIETVTNEKLLQQLDAVNASYEKRIKLQTATEVNSAKNTILDSAKAKRDEALLMLELGELAAKGDKAALAAWNEKLSAKQVNMAGLRSINFFNIQEISKTAGQIIMEDYQKQLEDAKTEILNLAPDIKMGEAKQKSAEISAFLDEAQNKFVYMGDTDKSKISQTNLNRIKSLFKEIDMTAGDIEKYGVIKSGRGAKKDLGAEADKMTEELKKLLGYEEAKKIVGGSGSNSGLGSGVDTISGDSRIAKNLTINIAEMGNDMQIITQSTTEAKSDIKKNILEALLAAVNDVNAA